MIQTTPSDSDPSQLATTIESSGQPGSVKPGAGSFWKLSNWKLWTLLIAPILIIAIATTLYFTLYKSGTTITNSPSDQNQSSQSATINQPTSIPTGEPSNLLTPLNLSSVQPRLIIQRDGKTYSASDDGNNMQLTSLFDQGGVLGGSRKCLFYVKNHNLYRALIDGSSSTQITNYDPAIFSYSSQVQGATTPSKVLSNVGPGYGITVETVDHSCSQAIVTLRTNGSNKDIPLSAYFYIAPEKYEKPIEIGETGIGRVLNFDSAGVVYFETSQDGSRYITKLNSRFNLEKAFASPIMGDRWPGYINPEGWAFDTQFNPQTSSSALLMYSLNDWSRQSWASAYGFFGREDPDKEALDPSIHISYWGSFENTSIQPTYNHVVYSTETSKFVNKYGTKGEVLLSFNRQSNNMIQLETASNTFQDYGVSVWINNDSFIISALNQEYISSVYTCSVATYKCSMFFADASISEHVYW